MRRRFFGAEAGVGADGEFGELCFRGWFAGAQRAEDRGDEAERNRDDAGIGQREERRMLDQVASAGRDGRRIDRHDSRADDDETDGAGETDREALRRPRQY